MQLLVFRQRDASPDLQSFCTIRVADLATFAVGHVADYRLLHSDPARAVLAAVDMLSQWAGSIVPC